MVQFLLLPRVSRSTLNLFPEPRKPGVTLAPGSATHAHQRGVVADTLPFPSCGMALVPLGGNKIALSTITRIVNPSTTNTRTAGLPEIEPYPSLGNGMLL